MRYMLTELNELLDDETYVRFVSAPNTRMGVVSSGTLDGGKPRYFFRHDNRFKDVIPDLFVFADEIEVCERPTDEQVRAINVLIERGT
ncbi:MAG: hypothetical protein ACRD3E_20535 [Terriglobales bacterium]